MCLRVVFDKIRLLFVCRGLTSDDVAELRAMRHELCNHLCAISGLAQLNESARISAYVSDLLGALRWIRAIPARAMRPWTRC